MAVEEMCIRDSGNVVLFSARGEPSVIFEITNPVQQLCTDAQQYMLFHDVQMCIRDRNIIAFPDILIIIGNMIVSLLMQNIKKIQIGMIFIK